MSFIEKCVLDTVGININDNFKIRYHGHDFKKCRLVRMNTSLEYNESFTEFFNKYCPDFVSVCCYYSRRYKTEHEYVTRITNKESKKYILYLSNNNIDKIVSNFKNTYFVSSSVDSVISSKYMNFMWKWFIHNENIPNVLSVGSLKEMLNKIIPFDEENDCYTHVECVFFKQINVF